MKSSVSILAMLATIGLISCTSPVSPSPSPSTPAASVGECHPTIAYMTPPSEAFEFFVGGSTSPDAREVAKTLNWYGNDAMWVILPIDGKTPPGRLGDKIPPYRMKRGQVEWEARRLDGPGTVSKQRIGDAAYGDIGFAAGGPGFPTVGCWEVTYTLDGHDALRFVLKVT